MEKIATLGEKFQQLLQNENLTAGKLAEMLGVQPSVISHLTAGRNKPSYALIQTILRRFPHINPDWLLLDAENIYRDGYEPSAPAISTEPDLFSPAQSADREPASDEHTYINAPSASQTVTENSTSRESNISELTAVRSEISNSRTTAKIERIIVLYSDGTFCDFGKRL